MISYQQWIRSFFSKMKELHGATWTKKFGEQDSGIWLECLQQCSIEKLDYGLKVLLHSDDHTFSKSPINPLDFRRLCKGYLREEDRAPKTPLWISQSLTPATALLLTGNDEIESKRVAYINLLKVYKHLGNRNKWDRLKSDYNIFCAKYGAGDKTEIQKRTLIAEIAAHKQLIEEFDTVQNYAVSNAYREQLEKKEEELFKITAIAA